GVGWSGSGELPRSRVLGVWVGVGGRRRGGLALLVVARGERPEPMRAALPVAAFLVPLPLAGHRALGPLMAASRAAAGLCSSAGSHGFHAGSRGDYGSCQPYSPDFLDNRAYRPLVLQRAVCLSVG